MTLIRPERPALANERWIVGVVVVVFFGFLLAEIVSDYSPVKLSVVFMVSFMTPLIALHEAGHALASRLFGWRVCRIVVGYGRPILRLRWGGTPVEVRLLPLGGHVVPAPTRLRSPRLENAVIFAAGPLAELSVALLVMALVGPARLFSASESLHVIAAQSLALLVAIDLFMNLLPLPSDSDGKSGVSDGLGLVMSPFLPTWHFRRAMALPWVLQAEVEQHVEDRIRIFQDGVEEQPDNPFMRLYLAEALLAARDTFGAREQRRLALHSQKLPRELESELRATLGPGA